MKFHKDKSKILYLAEHNPGVQHRLDSTWLGSSSVQMDLGVLVNKSSMSEQCAAETKQAHGMLGCINKDTTVRDKEFIVLLYSALATPHLEYCVWFWSSLCNKLWTGWRGSREGPCEERLRVGFVQP